MQTDPILLVPGEPRSIFFEIFFKSIKSKDFKSPLIVICCKNLILGEIRKLNYKVNYKIVKADELFKINLKKKTLYIVDIKLKKKTDSKINNYYIKKYLIKSFLTAFEILKMGLTKKFINGPINKKKFLNKKFYGMTEYISEYFHEKKIGMLIYNEKLSVCPLTTHLPIKLVAKNITTKLVKEKIDIVNKFFIENFKKKPKIGVTSLNPHCESILGFNEDKQIILPAIKKMKNKGIWVTGPHPADTIFMKNYRTKFDIIIGMYHDQVLGPLKTLFEFDAINITMGLPFLRVTPDHGPNEIMFGKNKSNPKSLAKALKFLDNR